MTSQPVYTDRYRTPLIQLLTPTVAGIFLTWGLLGTDLTLVAIGLGLALFVWFTKHSRYLLFPDRLVIRYGAARQKEVPVSGIESAEVARLPMSGLSVVLRRSGGQPMVLTPSKPEEFLKQLEALIQSNPHREVAA